MYLQRPTINLYLSDKAMTIGLKRLRTQRKPAANSTFAIGGGSCSADSFVVKGSLVLRMNICAEKPAHRKSANR